MIKSQSVWLVLLSLFLGVQLYIFFFKPKVKEPEPTPTRLEVEAKSDQILQRMQGGHLVETQGGRRDWELLSKVSISYQGRNDWDLEGVEIRFYNSDFKDMVVKGEKGNIDMSTKDMKITGDVRIESSNGYVFYAPFIEYIASLRTIRCDQAVRVQGPLRQGKRALQLTAVGIEIPVNERKMKLLNKVKGTQVAEDGQTIQISSQSAELSSLSHSASFDGDVSLQTSNQALSSQKAIFTYDDSTKKFAGLEMKGKVILSQGSRRVTSEDLKIDFATQKLTFSGQPRLFQDEDELVGDKIIFLDGGKRVKVEKVKAKGKSPE